MRLAGKVAVVTGGARGIGRAVALGLAREGANVLVGDVRVGQQPWPSPGPGEGRVVERPADVTSVADLAALMQAAVDELGRLDLLFNNAGVLNVRPVLEVTEEEWDRVLDVNLKGAFFAAQAAARQMVQFGGGVIVNVASTSGFVASANPTIPYDASKGGVRQMTVSLAVHLAPLGIRVNAIAPGSIETDLTLGVYGRERLEQRGREKVPLRRIGQPVDLVGAVVYLCSDEASYVTGHTLVIDGGILAI